MLDNRPVHGWFGLSYAAYLVLPRLVMESMPQAWQRGMVKLLEQVEEELGHNYGENGNEYDVTLIVNGGPLPDPMANYRHVRLKCKSGEESSQAG